MRKWITKDLMVKVCKDGSAWKYIKDGIPYGAVTGQIVENPEEWALENKQKIDNLPPPERVKNTAYDYLVHLRDNLGLPYNVGGAKHTGKASNSDIRRLLENGGVEINGERPKPNDEITYPVKSLVWFPKSQHKITAL